MFVTLWIAKIDLEIDEMDVGAYIHFVNLLLENLGTPIPRTINMRAQANPQSALGSRPWITTIAMKSCIVAA